MGRKLRKLFRPVVALFSMILSPWAWSVKEKKPSHRSRIRIVTAVAMMLIVFIAPLAMGSAGIHIAFVHECWAAGCGLAWIILGEAAIAVLCGGLAGPAVFACEATFAA